MEQRFLISTYDPEVVGNVPQKEGMLDVAYYIGNGNFGFNKIESLLFEDYRGAKETIDFRQMKYTQIEEVFL